VLPGLALTGDGTGADVLAVGWAAAGGAGAGTGGRGRTGAGLATKGGGDDGMLVTAGVAAGSGSCAVAVAAGSGALVEARSESIVAACRRRGQPQSLDSAFTISLLTWALFLRGNVQAGVRDVSREGVRVRSNVRLPAGCDCNCERTTTTATSNPGIILLCLFPCLYFRPALAPDHHHHLHLHRSCSSSIDVQLRRMESVRARKSLDGTSPSPHYWTMGVSERVKLGDREDSP
jgi:hypothetical protein